MNKDNVLNTINLFGKATFQWSAPIIDDEYLNTKKEIYNVKGYGIYDSKIENRFCLLIDLPNNSGKDNLTTLLMNPSNTFPADVDNKKNMKSRFDQTIRNLIVLANALNYRQTIVLNVFSYIEGNSKQANEYCDTNKSKKIFEQNKKLNFKFTEKILSDSTDILVACGDNVKPELYSEYFKIIKRIKDKQQDKVSLYTYTKELTSNHRPRHLSLQAPQNRILYNQAVSDKKLYELEIADNEFKLK